MKHCVLCIKFQRMSVLYGEPVDFDTYLSLDLKTRQDICEHKYGDKPVIVYRCTQNKDICYSYPDDCKFGGDCLECSSLLLSRFECENDLPRWLINRKEEFEFPLVVVYCSKKKKSSQLIIMPPCVSFELKDE